MVGGLVLAVAAGTHLVAAAFGIAAISSLALSSLVVPRWRRVAPVAAGGIVGLAPLTGGVNPAATPGNLGFGGVGSGDPLSGPPLSVAGAAAQFRPDPVHRHARRRRRQSHGTARCRQDGVRAQGLGLERAPRGTGRRTPVVGALPASIVALLLVGVAVTLGPAPLRAAALAAPVLGLGLFLVGLIFALRYDEF